MIVASNLRSLQFVSLRRTARARAAIIGCSDHTRAELVELLDLARRGSIDLSRAVSRTVPIEVDTIKRRAR